MTNRITIEEVKKLNADVMEIKITKGRVVLVDSEDFEYLNQWKWHCTKGYASRRGNPGKKTILMHRVINKTPDNMIVDHINGNGLDNRKENLRNCTFEQNQWNVPKSKRGAVKYKGVSMNYMGRFQVVVSVKNRSVYLGIFKTEEDAAEAYDEYVTKHRGEFALTNKMLGLLPKKALTAPEVK